MCFWLWKLDLPYKIETGACSKSKGGRQVVLVGIIVYCNALDC